MAGKPSYGELEKRVQALEEAAEAELPTLGDALEKLFDLSTDMLCVADSDGHFRMVNSSFERTLGYDRQVLLKTPSIEFVHPDDKAATLAARKQLLATGEPVTHFENRYRCKDGSYKWLAWSSVTAPEEGFVYAVARDITRQKVLQQELAAQRDLFGHVLSNVPASIFWKDRNSVYLGANQRFARDTGIQNPEELIGKTDYDLAWTREEADFYRACDREVMDSREPMLNIEESQQQANGEKIELLTNKVPLLDESGQVTGILGIYMNITDKKRAEEIIQDHRQKLAHVIRLSTMGEMASTMAHELNQPLTALTSYCGTAISLAKSAPALPQELCDILERASAQVHRAGQIIRHLRDFVGKDSGHKQPVDIDQIIDGINVILTSELKSANVKLEHRLNTQGRKVMANQVQIEQVIINLVMNSIEAIQSIHENDGKIILETQLLKDESIEVTVIDNGPGIDMEIFDKMFNPFQTSKESGMGMGLTIIRSIIEAHGGRVWADEQRSKGVLFGFSLTACE